MTYRPKDVDLDLWHFSAADRFEQYSLVRDELLAMQNGKSHLYRRRKKSSMSKAALLKSLETLNSPIYERSEYSYSFRNNASIGERRNRIGQIIGSGKTGTTALLSHMSGILDGIIDGKIDFHFDRSLTRNSGGKRNILYMPISEELVAASMVMAGPKKTMQVFVKYLNWRLKGARREVQPDIAWLPVSSLILTETESEELLRFVFSKISRSFARKNRHYVIELVQDQYRGGTALDNLTVLGMLLRKYPKLIDMLEKKGWESSRTRHWSLSMPVE